jgi:hypothetical protein
LYLCRRLLTSFRFTIEHCVHLLFMLKVIGKHIYAPLIFSSPCQRQSELLPSLGVRRPLNFHILIFSSETACSNDIYGRSSIKLAHFGPISARHSLFDTCGTNEKVGPPTALRYWNIGGPNRILLAQTIFLYLNR